MSNLELKNVCVRAGESEVVQDVSFTVPKASISVLMGPNGSGKSTLVNALMGHPNYSMSSGSIFLDGNDITNLSTEKRAKQGIFLSLQHIPKIGGLSLATFLHKAHESMYNSGVSVLEFYAMLRDRADEFSISPTLLDKPLTAGLSGGEKKLSEVLQLIALKPSFAILDEIDSGVDVDALYTVFRAINKLKNEGTGFLIISHHPSLLEHLTPDSVHVMTKGRLVCSDGKELAEDILKKGFCVVAQCDRAGECSGTCR
jgi:Fe-S cluster assembly ATP-binding protein